MTPDFEIFCSYARSDNDDRWVEHFANRLAGTYRRLTGLAPDVFLDRESLITADIWQAKIRLALDASQVLIAVVSPSFVRSEWCRREWDAFAVREVEFRRRELLAEEQGLIFPILLYPLDRGQFDEDQSAFAALIRERQMLDVSSQLEGTPLRPDQLRRLAENVIDTLAELTSRPRSEARAAASAAIGITIRDPALEIEWSAGLSPYEMSFNEALNYVAQLEIRGSGGWRLPTKAELEGTIDPSELSDDPTATPVPLREPFNAQRSGYLHSGTLVFDDPEDGNYVMRVQNGHVFNGKGYNCLVRAVRDL
jgi:hypothetical protein